MIVLKLLRKRILIILILVLAVCSIKAVPVLKDVIGAGGDSVGIYTEIEQGETLKETAQKLVSSKVIEYPTVFYYYAKGRAQTFQYGGHVFSTDMSYRQICDELAKPGTGKTVSVVIPEGYEIRLIAEAFERAGLFSKEEFVKALSHDYDFPFAEKRSGTIYDLEGFLFPATYDFNYGIAPHTVIQTMLDTFSKVYNDEYRARAKELGMTDYDVVTLASVIEREAATTEEHKKVSGVFYNRIKDGMSLQSCATVQYILKERKEVLSIADTEIDSPYNTYKYAGLPVGPIACPGKSAIEAALYPESHDYYYFVAKSDGSGHVFSKTFAEHEKAANSR